MNLYIVRHGETWANVESRYLGALDPDLTDKGRQQAESLDAQLPASVSALVVSPLVRARQTAEILNRTRALKLQVLTGLRERHVGVFEGLTQTEAREQHPDLWRRNITRHWALAPTGGESIFEVVSRVHTTLHQLQEQHAGETVVIVAHGFIAKTIRALARQDFSDFYKWQLGNGSVLTLGNVQAPTASPESWELQLPIT